MEKAKIQVMLPIVAKAQPHPDLIFKLKGGAQVASTDLGIRNQSHSDTGIDVELTIICR